MHTYDKSYSGPKCVSSSFISECLFPLRNPFSAMSTDYTYSMQFSIPQYIAFYSISGKRQKRTHIFTRILLSFQSGYIFYTETQHAISFQFSLQFQYFYGYVYSFSFFARCHFSWDFLFINWLFGVWLGTMKSCLTATAVGEKEFNWKLKVRQLDLLIWTEDKKSIQNCLIINEFFNINYSCHMYANHSQSSHIICTELTRVKKPFPTINILIYICNIECL